MEILPYRVQYVSPMAKLFIHNLASERQFAPDLPQRLLDPALVMEKMADLFCACPGVVAVEDGRVLGYMGWFIIEGLRNTNRKAAFVPEWGHSAEEAGKEKIYRALYRYAAQYWCQDGCQAHAVSLLAHDKKAIETWFWNGFGLTVVDAVRSITPLDIPYQEGVEVRFAREDDASELEVLEAEHWEHYIRPPVLMTPDAPRDRYDFKHFIQQGHNRAAIAYVRGIPAGYMTFEAYSHGAAEVVMSDTTTANTGAYVRPDFRGNRIGAALLDVALKEYSALGYKRCSVDFESFNPEAVAFWLKYFTPVCYSVIRAPERV